MTDHLRTLLEPVQAVAEATAQDADEKAAFPTATLGELRRSGLLGLLVDRAHGGLGGGLDELVDVTEALGRVDLSVALIFAMHCQQVAAVQRYGGPDLTAEFLPEIAQGELYLVSVTTAPGSGATLLSSSEPAERAADAIRVYREAPIVTGGQHADAYLVTMGTPGATSPAEVDLILARRDQLRIEVTGGWQPVGMRATESVPLRLSGEVPTRQVIGGHGGFRTIATECFAPLAHVGWSAAWLGTAAGALSRVVTHARASRGRRLVDPSSESALLRVGAIRGRIDVVHAMLRHTVGVLDRERDASRPHVQLLVNRLKTLAAAECFAAVDDLVQLVGLRHGYLTGSPLRLERAWRDLRSASLSFADERLVRSNGALALMDSGVHLASCGSPPPGND